MSQLVPITRGAPVSLVGDKHKSPQSAGLRLLHGRPAEPFIRHGDLQLHEHRFRGVDDNSPLEVFASRGRTCLSITAQPSAAPMPPAGSGSTAA